jgi:hypothetical protein
MAEPDPERFVEKFTRVWSDPQPQEVPELWADGGKLLHPTMGESLIVANDGRSDDDNGANDQR